VTKLAPIDFSKTSPSEHLGGWLLVFTALFAISALDCLVAVIVNLTSGRGLVINDFAPLVCLALMVGFMLVKSKRCHLFYYCYAVYQILMVVLVAVAAIALRTDMPVNFLNKQMGTLSRGETLIGAVVIIGIFVGIEFYFHKSKRVAVYFASKPL